MAKETQSDRFGEDGKGVMNMVKKPTKSLIKLVWTKKMDICICINHQTVRRYTLLSNGN